MQQVTGTVTNSWSQQKVSKAGKNYTVNYIQVDSVDFPISTGFKAEHQQGETISIYVDKKFGEMQKVPAPVQGMPQAPAQAVAQAPAVVGVAEFPIAPGSRQISIIRQSSLKCAVEVLGEYKGNGTLDEHVAEIINLAQKFTDFGSGQDIREVLGA
jgi:hypothetical protein